MFRLAVCCLALSAVLAKPPPGQPRGQCCGRVNRASRIVGGVETEVNEYPWQAGLVAREDTRTFCGGTVINNRYVLTAAHCLVGWLNFDVQVLLREHKIGAADGEMRYDVSKLINHPKYTDAYKGYDFALLRLAQQLDFSALNNKVAPACLPSSSSGAFANVDAIVSGWGTTASGGQQATKLLEVTVKTLSNQQCLTSYQGVLNDKMLCAGVAAGGKDSCQGDSGGPLVTAVSGRYTLIGVVSFGMGCGEAAYPGVYARVTEELAWITQNTADAGLC